MLPMPVPAIDIPNSWESGPFGDTDASRSDALANYLDIEGVMPSLNNATDLLRHRFIIGKKGSGKTHYLRALRQRLSRSEFYIQNASSKLASSKVIEFTQKSQKHYLRIAQRSNMFVDPNFYIREFWESAWDRAIYATAYSIIADDIRSKQYNIISKSISDRDWSKEFQDELFNFFPEIRRSRSIISVLNGILHIGQKFGALVKFLNDPIWDSLKEMMDSISNQITPIVIIIDAIDDNFEVAPEAWLYCQDGLFKAVINQLNQGSNFSNRVHIISAIRDVVYSSLYRSDHALRYVNDSHIFHILWDYRSIRNFLFSKIKNSEYISIRNENESNALSKWLGFSSIRNESRNISEPVVEYVLRHTRLVPRDIVLFGNMMHSSIEKNADFDSRDVTNNIHTMSRALAGESIKTCVTEALMSQELLANLVISLEDGQGFSELDERAGTVRSMVNDLRRSVEDRIGLLVGEIGSETFSYLTLKEALIKSGLASRLEFEAPIENGYRFDHILWRQGLIAYFDQQYSGSSWNFYSGGPFEDFFLTDNQSLYGFHSILLDKYRSHISRLGDNPVI